MSKQICPGCNATINATLNKCPHCNLSIRDSQKEIVGGLPLTPEERAEVEAVYNRPVSAQQSQSGNILNTVVLIIILLAFFGWFGGWFSFHSGNTLTDQFAESSSANIAAPSSDKPDLELVDCQWKRGQYGNRTIVATVRNNSSKAFSYAQIEVNLYDDGGTQVGSTMTNVTNLQPGTRWEFEAGVLEDRATKAQVMSLSGH